MSDWEWRSTWPVQAKALDSSSVSVLVGLLKTSDGTWFGLALDGGDPTLLSIDKAIDLSMAVRDAITERYRVSNHEGGKS
jgi:hypothetical protein